MSCNGFHATASGVRSCPDCGPQWRALDEEVARYKRNQALGATIEKEVRPRTTRSEALRASQIRAWLDGHNMDYVEHAMPLKPSDFEIQPGVLGLRLWWDEYDTPHGYAWGAWHDSVLHGGFLDTLEQLEHLTQGGYIP